MFDMRTLAVMAAVFVITYLLGSLNFAVIVSRLLYHDDVRSYGSGNAGMTNMLRTYGKKAAFLTGLGDFSKGMASVLIGRLLFAALGIDDFDGGYIGAVGVRLGHLFPLYFHFKGGKGILAITGAILLLNPDIFAILFVCFVPIAFITRIVSLASVTGAMAYPILVYIKCRIIGRPPTLDVVFSIACVAIILYMHRENIRRLLNGTEKKIGEGKK